jgi:hypothetical protein
MMVAYKIKAVARMLDAQGEQIFCTGTGNFMSKAEVVHGIETSASSVDSYMDYLKSLTWEEILQLLHGTAKSPFTENGVRRTLRDRSAKRKKMSKELLRWQLCKS